MQQGIIINRDATSNPAVINLHIDALKPQKRQLSSSTKDYMRQYYQKNREKALAYQREYYRKHKKSYKKRIRTHSSSREAFKQVYTSYDIMQLSTEKAIRTLNKIIQGDRGYIG
ncbi:MAG: hypothetical protein R3F48_13245 [Candidatus Zixiibacteriota bacterium]